MEYRKLISFGKNSFVISLPKSWVVHNSLKKGDIIYVDEKDSSLILETKGDAKNEDKSKIIDVDGKSLDYLRRELISAYIDNYREIIFQGKEIPLKTEKLLDEVRYLIALEVLELDSQKIVTKDFLNMDKASVTELVKKIDMILRSMFKDCTNDFPNIDAGNILLRDKDVNRLLFLVFRAIRYGLRNPTRTLKNFDLSPIDLLNCYLAVFYLEDIADQTKRIARLANKIKLPRKEEETFVGMIKECEQLYLNMIKSYYQSDVKKAFEHSMLKGDILKRINAFYEKNKNIDEISQLTNRFQHLVAIIHEFGRLVHQH